MVVNDLHGGRQEAKKCDALDISSQELRISDVEPLPESFAALVGSDLRNPIEVRSPPPRVRAFLPTGEQSALLLRFLDGVCGPR